MSHTLTTHGGLCDLDAASVTDNTLITYLLILTAVALPILGWSKNAFAEKTVLLRLEGTIVDGLRLLDFTVGPLADFLRRSKSDTDDEMLDFDPYDGLDEDFVDDEEFLGDDE